MHVYLYMYLHVYIYLCVCVCVYIYIYIYVCMHIFFVYLFACVCIYIFIMYLFVYVIYMFYLISYFLQSLSKKHACIEVRGRSHFIFDMGSRNRTRRGTVCKTFFFLSFFSPLRIISTFERENIKSRGKILISVPS